MSEPTQTPRSDEEWAQMFVQSNRCKGDDSESFKERLLIVRQIREESSKELKDAKDELEYVKKDYRLLSGQLDGHDAAECSLNLGNLKRELAAANEIIAAYPEGAIETLKKWHEMKRCADGLAARIKTLEEALQWAMGMQPSPCRCLDFSSPPHVCIGHKALSPQEG